MSDPQAFWAWFQSAHPRLLRLRAGPDEALLDEIQDHLQRYSPGLWFEIGGHPEGPMELVISAEGDPDYFPDVRRLVDCAPAVEGWQFIAFKPAQGFEFTTEYEEVVIDPATSWFLPLESGSTPPSFGLRVAVPGFDDDLEQTFRLAVHIALDTGLGELAASEQIQHLQVVDVPETPEADGYIELNQLAEYLAWRARSEA